MCSCKKGFGRNLWGIDYQRSGRILLVVNTSAVENHEQVWVKVNAQVDAGIARLVSILNRVDGLQTIASCEGIAGQKPAYVYFNYGDWQRLSALMFETIGPALWNHFENEATVSVEVFNGSEPMGKLSFDKEATNVVASLLEGLLR